ncbi:MAG: L-lactate dehydrogenase [Oscillospiraceae bacterium]
MGSKITIIGAGSVGSTIAYTLSNESVASEIVLIDVNKKKLEGEVMDIMQGTGFRDPISIVAGDYSDAKDSDIVIITSGIARRPGQTRIELVQTNVDILKDITENIVREAPNALYIIVSNPVDIITYVFSKISGLPSRQIIGSGTLLDTTRLRSRLSECCSVSQRNIHAYVFGEHGDSSFVPWSCAEIAGFEFDDYVDYMMKEGMLTARPDKDQIVDFVHKSGGQIIANKGATFYAVSVSVCRLCNILLSAYNSIITVSSMMQGEYGIEDVCISTLNLVGPKGIAGKPLLKLTDEETAKLVASANKLKDVIRQIKI